MEEKYFWLIFSITNFVCAFIFAIACYLEPTNFQNWLIFAGWIICGIIFFANYKDKDDNDNHFIF